MFGYWGIARFSNLFLFDQMRILHFPGCLGRWKFTFAKALESFHINLTPLPKGRTWMNGNLFEISTQAFFQNDSSPAESTTEMLIRQYEPFPVEKIVACYSQWVSIAYFVLKFSMQFHLGAKTSLQWRKSDSRNSNAHLWKYPIGSVKILSTY